MRIARLALLVTLPLMPVANANGQQTQVGMGKGETYRVEFEYRRWNAKLTSELEVGLGATKISPTDDLGIDDKQENEFLGAVRIISWLKARGSYVRYQYDATRTATRDLTYAGVTFPAGTTVDTAMTLKYTTIGGEADLFSRREFVFSVVGDYTRFEADTVLSSADQGEADAGLMRVDLPTFGLKARVYLTPNFALTVEASGMRRESEGVLTNVDAVATFNFNPHAAVSFGYQNRYARVAGVAVRETFRLKGGYLGVTLRF